jgi:hypothetical protein
MHVSRASFSEEARQMTGPGFLRLAEIPGGLWENLRFIAAIWRYPSSFLARIGDLARSRLTSCASSGAENVLSAGFVITCVNTC